MASVRITGNTRNPNKMEWLGAPKLDAEGHIERTIKIPEPVYEAMENSIARGDHEGTILLQDDTKFQWFADLA